MTNLNHLNGAGRAKRPSSDGGTVGGCLVLLLLFLIVLPAAAALGAVITMLAWNLGVVAIVAACGGAVAKIGFWTALFANIALGVVARLFGSRPAASK